MLKKVLLLPIMIMALLFFMATVPTLEGNQGVTVLEPAGLVMDVYELQAMPDHTTLNYICQNGRYEIYENHKTELQGNDATPFPLKYPSPAYSGSLMPVIASARNKILRIG